MKKILLIQLRKLGDVILTTPIIDVLHEKFGGHGNVQIDFLTEKEYSKILFGNPRLTNIYSLDKNNTKNQLNIIKQLRHEKYDYVFDFFGNPRSAWLSFFSGAKYKYGYDFKGRKFLYNRIIKRDTNSKYAVDFKMDLLKDFSIHPGYRKTSVYVEPEIFKKQQDLLFKSGWDCKQKNISNSRAKYKRCICRKKLDFRKIYRTRKQSTKRIKSFYCYSLGSRRIRKRFKYKRKHRSKKMLYSTKA